MYVCLEGTEGVGKSTQTAAIYQTLLEKYGSDAVVCTSEPGNKRVELTMKLRQLMLDAQFDDHMDGVAREFISQAARSININSVVIPSLIQNKIVIQDRGLLSGFAYGITCGHSEDWLRELSLKTCEPLAKIKPLLYDLVIILKTSKTSDCLHRAKKSKHEFKEGDNIENRGDFFMNRVAHQFKRAKEFLRCPVLKVKIDDKTIEQVHNEILSLIGIFYDLKK